MSMEKKGRGRPRKNFQDINSLSENTESKATSSQVNDLEIDKTDFDFYEPENFTAPSVEQFNPLADAPIKREYATPKIQEGIQGEIVEPTFHQPTFNSNPKPLTPNLEGQGSASASQTFKNPNPALNEVDNAEKKLACEQMVDAALDVYETVWGLGGRLAQVSEEKIQGLINDGSINPKRRIPVEDSSVSIFEFFQNYNNQVVEASKVDTTFKKKVRPPLVRVFMKNGWGMTDEQFLGIAFAKDSLMRGISLFQMKKSINALINQLSEENSENKPLKTPKKKPTPPPVQEEIVTPEIEEIFDDDDDFMETNEPIMPTPPPPPPPAPRTTDKFDINFGDNPLRQDTRREPPAPKVEEYFQQGGEIIDEPENTNE